MPTTVEAGVPLPIIFAGKAKTSFRSGAIFWSVAGI